MNERLNEEDSIGLIIGLRHGMMENESRDIMFKQILGQVATFGCKPFLRPFYNFNLNEDSQ